MTPFQQRVVDEKSELDAKTAKLYDFINANPTFKTVPADEQTRLQRQYTLMYQYSEVLGERIAAFPA